MENLLIYSMALLGGFAIGIFFFGGLWLTISRFMAVEHPGPFFTLSLLVRSLVSVAGFYLIAGPRIENALVAMAGFLVARVVFMRIARPQDSQHVEERASSRKLSAEVNVSLTQNRHSVNYIVNRMTAAGGKHGT